MPDRPPAILIIDNDEAMVAALVVRLESLGYRCLAAGSGAQGLAVFREDDVDLVITDLNMPAGDGIVLTRTLRETSGVPIVIVTGFQDEYRRELRSLPNVTLMKKPFDANELVDVIEAQLVLTGCHLP